MAHCRNPSVVGFWKDIAEKASGESALTSVAPYITSKLNGFIYNGFIRSIIGQAKSTIDFRQIMDAQGILLIKLPKGLLGEFDAQLLGSFILSRMFSAAMGRANVTEHERPAFHLYVDEFQNFINDGVAFMLAEARKYGLFLTLANQTLSQLSENSSGKQNVLDAVLGNVGSLITFRVGPRDAASLQLYTEPELNAVDLQSLPNYHAAARILTCHGVTRPFVFATLPQLSKRPQKPIKSAVREARERAHSRLVVEVETAIAARHECLGKMAEIDVKEKTPASKDLACG
jgi:hypothetical protein